MEPALHGKMPRAGEGDIIAFQGNRGLPGLQGDLFLGVDVDAVVNGDDGDVLVGQDFELVGMGLDGHRGIGGDGLDTALVGKQGAGIACH